MAMTLQHASTLVAPQMQYQKANEGNNGHTSQGMHRNSTVGYNRGQFQLEFKINRTSFRVFVALHYYICMQRTKDNKKLIHVKQKSAIYREQVSLQRVMESLKHSFFK